MARFIACAIVIELSRPHLSSKNFDCETRSADGVCRETLVAAILDEPSSCDVQFFKYDLPPAAGR